jgi:hypothetical protein
VWTALLAALAGLGGLLGYDPHDPEKGRRWAAKLLATGLAGAVLFALLRRQIGS